MPTGSTISAANARNTQTLLDAQKRINAAQTRINAASSGNGQALELANARPTNAERQKKDQKSGGGISAWSLLKSAICYTSTPISWTATKIGKATGLDIPAKQAWDFGTWIVTSSVAQFFFSNAPGFVWGCTKQVSIFVWGCTKQVSIFVWGCTKRVPILGSVAQLAESPVVWGLLDMAKIAGSVLAVYKVWQLTSANWDAIPFQIALKAGNAIGVSNAADLAKNVADLVKNATDLVNDAVVKGATEVLKAASPIADQVQQEVKKAAWSILAGAAQSVRESIDPILKEPFKWAGWGAGKAAQFVVTTVPEVASSFAKGVLDDPYAAALVTTYAVGLYWLLTTRIPPRLAIEYKEVTRTSLALDWAKKKIGEFTAAHQKDAPQAHAAYEWLFPKPEEPVFNKSLNSEVSRIERSIKNAIHHDTYLENLLLEGPPGTGKTMVASKIARDSGCNFVRMSGSDLIAYIERGTGAHVRELQRMLAFGSDTHRPTILFIDEMDIFAKKKDTLPPAQQDLLYAFLSNTGSPSKKLMIIGTTNHVGNMDSAALSRFGTILHVGKPDEANRFAILKEHVNKQFPAAKFPERKTCLDDRGLRRIAAQTEGLVGRDLQQLVSKLTTVRGQTDTNRLSEEAIDNTVRTFKQQKQSVDKTHGVFAKITAPFSTFWQFTLARWRRALTPAHLLR